MTAHTTEHLHIVPVGLSILTNSGWKNGDPLPPKHTLRTLLHDNPRRMSAELNAMLPFIQRGECTSAHLIGTDTPPNALCRELLAAFLSQHRVHVTGAKAQHLAPQALDLAHDPDAFYEAIRRFRELVYRVVRRARHRSAEIYINATGGLKAEVAVVALLAAEFKAPAYYIHESMTEPIFLPTAPLDPKTVALLQQISQSRPPYAEVPQPQLQRLAREGLITLSREPYDPHRITRIRLTHYGKSLIRQAQPTQP